MNFARYLICLAIVVSLLENRLGNAADPILEIGFGSVEITPPIGVPMSGYYRPRYCTGVHDPIHAKSMVIRAGGQTAAIVSLDLAATTKPLVAEVRQKALETLGLPPECVMVSATHAHTGPVLSLAGRDSLVKPEAASLLEKYLADLPTRVFESIEQGVEQLRPAKLWAANGHCPDLAFNRRFFMKDGSVGWNPPKQSPEVIRTVGPTDDSVPMAYVTDTEGQPRGLYTNFAMHLDTVGGSEISADYPFALGEMMRRWKGDDLHTMFTIGCAGDINHRNVAWADRQKGITEATRIGTVLAGAAMQALIAPREIAGGSLVCQRKVVSLRTPTVTDQDIQAAKQVRRDLIKGERISFMQQVEAFKILDIEKEGTAIEAEVQVIRLGDQIAWVGLPGEIFVELGLDLKAASPVAHTMIAELAGGSVGYIPTRRAYREGNYEVVSARVGEGSGEILVETALDLLSSSSPEADETSSVKVSEPVR